MPAGLEVAAPHELFQLGCLRIRLEMYGGFDVEMFLDILRPVVARADQFSGLKVYQLGNLLCEACATREDKEDKELAMDFLADVVRTAKSDALKNSARWALRELER